MNEVPGYAVHDLLSKSPLTLIYHASREKDGAKVILKCPAQDIPDSFQLQQFEMSRQAQARIDHPSVNKCFELLTLENGYTLVLEDIQGISLKQWLRDVAEKKGEGPLLDAAHFHSRILRLLDWATQMAQGLYACHQSDVIHNDISPANVVVNPEQDRVQLIDFGAALLAESDTDEWELTHQHGTLTYISPEQTGRLNRNIDYRSDFYALGATFYQLFSGFPPFSAADLPELIHCHLARHPRPLSEVNPLLPEALSVLVQKLMAKTPEERYQSGRALIKDLQSIRRAVVEGVPFPAQELAGRDIPEKLFFSPRLFGREKALSALQSELDRKTRSGSLVLLKGPAGSGKTRLVEVAMGLAAAQNYQLLSGKFDQYQQQPFAPLITAATAGLENLLTLPESELKEWRAQLLQSLGLHTEELVEAIPLLSKLLGQESVPAKRMELPLEQAQVKVKLQMVMLLNILSRFQPLSLFIDDAHWGDNATFDVVESLIHQASDNILIVLSCRSESMLEGSPLDRFIKRLSQVDQPVSWIELNNLSVESTAEFLSDIFWIDDDSIHNLAALVHRKTLGNPLFIREYLRTASRQSPPALYFDRTEGHWQWQLERLEQLAVAGNVLEMLLDSINELPEATLKTLQWAALVGSQFELSQLANACGNGKDVVEKALRLAVMKGFVQRVRQHHVFEESESGIDLLPQHNTLYCFSHDRIQQVCYESLPETERAAKHWSIALSLINQRSTSPDDAAGHLDIALQSPQIWQNMEVEQARRCVGLFQEAADSAKKRNAFGNRLKYLRHIDRLANDFLKDDKALLQFNLLQLAEAEYLGGEANRGAKVFDRFRQETSDPIKQADAYDRQSKSALLIQDLEQSLASGLAGLRLLGVRLPALEQDWSKWLEQSDPRSGALSEHTLLSPGMTIALTASESAIIMQSILFTLSVGFRLVGRDDVLKVLTNLGVLNVLDQGFTRQSLNLLAGISTVQSSTGHIQQANQTLLLATELAEQHPDWLGAGTAYNHLSVTVGPYYHTFQHCVELLEQGQRISLDKGEYLPFLLCKANELVLHFAIGTSLEDLRDKIKELNFWLQTYGEIKVAGKHYWRLIDQLIDPSQPNYLQQDQFTEQEWSALIKTVEYAIVRHLRLQLFFWRGQFQELLDEVEVTEQLIQPLSPFIPVDEHHFIKVIATLQTLHHEDEVDTKQAISRIQPSLKHIEWLSTIQPENYLHKQLLVQAELLRLQNDYQASEMYYQAAEKARDSGFIQMFALAHELHARYWHDSGREDYARMHIARAVQAYFRWGCHARLEQIEQRWGVERGSLASLSPMNWPFSDSLGVSPKGHSQRLNQISLLKIAHAIAEEIDLERLLQRIVSLTVENAGAEMGMLLLQHNDRFGAYAEAVATDDGIVANSASGETEIPESAVNYCSQTQQPLVLEDMSHVSRYRHDPFFSKHPAKSFLCFPILHKSSITGMLILMNSRVKSAFANPHLQFLTTLAPQIAVSIENAQLYKQLQELNEALEQKVEARTQELVAANEELQAFSSAVSHDLKSPLRAIEGFGSALQEDFAQVLGDEGMGYLNHIVSASLRMREIIDGLLLLARSTQTTIKWEEVNISTLVEEKISWLRMMEPERVVEVSVQQGLITQGDLSLIRQAVDNLVTNAWKYTQPQATAEIEFGMFSGPGPNQSFYIKDNGIGFDADNAEGLFRPFRRFHREEEIEGSGIGLATVYRIVQRHGGHLSVASQPGKGATFYFSFG